MSRDKDLGKCFSIAAFGRQAQTGAPWGKWEFGALVGAREEIRAEHFQFWISKKLFSGTKSSLRV